MISSKLKFSEYMLNISRFNVFGKRGKGSYSLKKKRIENWGTLDSKKTPHHPPSNRLAEPMAPTWHHPEPNLYILSNLNTLFSGIDIMDWGCSKLLNYDSKQGLFLSLFKLNIWVKIHYKLNWKLKIQDSNLDSYIVLFVWHLFFPMYSPSQNAAPCLG